MFKLITSEAVTPGHPDKVCDQIADAILDEAIKRDATCHNAIEVSIKNNKCFIFGETSVSFEKNDIITLAKTVLTDIGYHGDTFIFDILVDTQSKEINSAVRNENAGDQGIMFGYATNETSTFMPAPIYYANLLANRLYQLSKETDIIKPDGKVQVTVRYVDGQFYDIAEVLISTSHSKNASFETVKNLVMKDVVYAVLPKNLLKNTVFLINPAGPWTNYGPSADSGTTGRKIVCDTYGGVGRVGGGCFSSKDPTKVDRSAAYYCRYVAKNLVAAGLCSKCEVGVSYAIGRSEPLSIEVNSFGTANDEALLEIINKNFNFRVSNIIQELNLRRPIYRETSNFGHFGHENYSWEQLKVLV